MKTKEFVSYLKTLDISLYVTEDKLKLDAPKGSLNNYLKQEIANRKAEIIAYLQTQEDITLKPIYREGNLPLYFAQERMWFFDQFEPDSCVYNIPCAIRMKGSLDIAALEKSINEIIRRHEVLRSSCQNIEGKPQLTIVPELTISLPVKDLSALSPEEQEQAVEQILSAEANTPFNLSVAPLVRVNLLHLNSEHHILVLSLHHFIADGWSMPILYREIATLYQAFSRGLPSPLKDFSIQYVDFAAWQQKLSENGYFESQLSYWKQQLSGSSFVLDLPRDRPRPSLQTYKGSIYSFKLSPELSKAIQKISREKGVTVFMTLLATFQTLLYRYTQQEDLIVATTVSNRQNIQLENLIGTFANNILLRANLANNPSFTSFLEQVKQTTTNAYNHQDFPFEKLVEYLQPKRDLSRNPLAQVFFILHQNRNDQEILLKLPELDWIQIPFKSHQSRLDLLLSMKSDSQGNLQGYFQYNTDLYDGDRIERMAAHFQSLLAAITTNPNQRLSELPLLTASERQQILVDWNKTQTDYPKDKCIHHLFEEQTQKNPDSIAVIFEEQKLTYRELNVKANHLANYLQQLGVKPETLVGICLKPSLEMIIGLLGILKAGGAYVPIDCNYPPERWKFIVEDTQLSLLLTQKSLATKLPETKAKILNLDTNWQEISLPTVAPQKNAIEPHHLAYVIYTSGSTGKPKGVMIEHRQIVNYICGIISSLDFSEIMNYLLIQSLSFDACLTTIFGSLCSGGTLHIMPQESFLDSQRVSRYFQQNKIDFLKITPSYLRALSTLDTIEEFIPKKILMIGGESSSWDWIKSLYLKSRNCRIVNHYGPTETTVGVSMYEITARNFNQNGVEITPIGKPLNNIYAYILDCHLQPVPQGIMGELFIGGDGVARGYLNRPELTTEKFIPNPFGEGRLYKTGDLVRYLSDGNIEYLGRIDHQVKLRGFRIELGEIEANLNQHPDVQESVVIAKENKQDNQYLVAYVKPKYSPTTSNLVANLRQFLQQKLPEYMIPSAFVFLDSFPLTYNGKIDLKALPDNYELNRVQEFIPPRNPTEIKLAAIWQEVLGVDKVGINDNFFNLGGYSLIATQVVSRIRNSFDIDFPLSYLFQLSTLAQLSEYIITLNWMQKEDSTMTDDIVEEIEL